MKDYKNTLLNKLPDYEFDFRIHNSDNSGLLYFDSDTIDEFWKWCEVNNLTPLGFCKIPQYRSEAGVGMMFEDVKTFDKQWFHIPQSSYCSVVRDLFGEEVLARVWL